MLLTVTLATILRSLSKPKGAHGNTRSPRMGSRTRMGRTVMITWAAETIMWERVTSPTPTRYTKTIKLKYTLNSNIQKHSTQIYSFWNTDNRKIDTNCIREGSENEHKCDSIAPSSINSKALQGKVSKRNLLYLQKKWSDIWPSVVTHTRNLCSAFIPSKCTHTAVNTHTHTHTHTVNTDPEQWAAIYAAAPGEQLGVRCLAQGSHLSRGIEGGESAGYSLPPPTIPAGLRPELATFALRVRLSNH